VILDKVFLKFISVGVINTAVGTAIMFVFYNIFGFGYWFSSAANYAVGSIVSFFLNKYWTFNVRKWSLFMVISFVLNIAICYILAYKTARMFIYALLTNQTQRLQDNVAMLVGICLFTGLNYVGQRFIVFKNRPH
jgi:putative flippase GtrA